MNVVIAGGGVVGQTLAQNLSDEEIDVVLIEKDPDLLDKIIGHIDITGLAGNTASYENLIEAGVEDADIFVSVTSSDEINLISAIMAKRIGAKYTIARVRNPEYTEYADFMRQDLGISLLVNPEWEAARDISHIIRFPEASSVEFFAFGKAVMLQLTVSEDSPLNGMSLPQFGQNYSDVLLITVERDGETFIPKGDKNIQPHDEIFVIGSRPAINTFYKKTGFKSERINTAMIIGSSQIAYYLIRLLKDIHVDVKVASNNLSEATNLSEEFPEALVVHGDTTDQEFLLEERLAYYDAVITLTQNDEENILNSLFALSEGVGKVITRVSNVNLLKILGGIELQSVITPKFIMANRILRFVRSLTNTSVSNVEGLVRIAYNEVEVLQFLVKDGAQIADIPLFELDMKENTIVAFITRDKKLIVPRGNDSIKVGDHVIVATKQPYFDDIDDILEEE